MNLIRAAIIAVLAWAVGPFCAFGQTTLNERRQWDDPYWAQKFQEINENTKRLFPDGKFSAGQTEGLSSFRTVPTQYPPDYFTIKPYVGISGLPIGARPGLEYYDINTGVYTPWEWGK